MGKLRTLLFLSAFISVVSLNAQYTVGISAGISTHGGDSNSWGRDGVDFYENAQFVIGAQVKRQLNDNIALSLQYRNTTIKGQDENLVNKEPFGRAIANRSLGYESNIQEFGLVVEYEFGAFFKIQDDEGKLENKSRKVLSPYVFGGFAFAFINDDEDLRDWGNPDVVREMDILLDQTQGSNGGIQIPLGLGFKANFSEQIYVDFKYSFRLPISDYLDGISESANPEKNDAYQMATIGLNYRI